MKTLKLTLAILACMTAASLSSFAQPNTSLDFEAEFARVDQGLKNISRGLYYLREQRNAYESIARTLQTMSELKSQHSGLVTDEEQSQLNNTFYQLVEGFFNLSDKQVLGERLFSNHSTGGMMYPGGTYSGGDSSWYLDTSGDETERISISQKSLENAISAIQNNPDLNMISSTEITSAKHMIDSYIGDNLSTTMILEERERSMLATRQNLLKTQEELTGSSLEALGSGSCNLVSERAQELFNSIVASHTQKCEDDLIASLEAFLNEDQAAEPDQEM